MIRDSDFKTLFLCSSAAGLVSGIFTNVLEVMKTQVMNDAMQHHGHDHGKPQIGFIHNSLADRLVITCRCYYCFLRDIVKEQGRGAYFKGVGYNASMTMMRSILLFPLYEYLQRTLLKWSKNANMHHLEFALPAVAGLTAKGISQTVTFPLEYMATLRQANVAVDSKKMSNGFGYTMYRELLYSACFWTFQENSYKALKKYMVNDTNAYIASAFFASSTSAIFSYPFDLLKTWKISYPERFTGSSSLAVSRRILHERGWSSILVGLAPRVVRVSSGNLIFFSVYSKLVSLLNSFKAEPVSA